MNNVFKQFENLATSLDLNFKTQKPKTGDVYFDKLNDIAIAKSNIDGRSLILEPADRYGDGLILLLKTTKEKNGYGIWVLEFIYAKYIDGQNINFDDLMPSFNCDTGQDISPRIELSQGWEGQFEFIRKHWNGWLKDEKNLL